MRRYARRKPAAVVGLTDFIKSNQKQLIILGAIAAAVIVAVAVLAQMANRQGFDTSFLVTNDTIKIGIRADVPGFGQIDENGEITGFDRDYIDEVMRRLLPGQEKLYKYVPITSQDAGANIKYGVTDVNLGLLVEGTSKVTGFMLSTPYYRDNVVAVVQSSSKLDKLKNMEGGSLGVLVTAIPESGVTNYLKRNNMNYDVLKYSDYESAMTDIEHSRVSAVVMPYTIAKQFESAGYRILAEPLYEVGYGILLPTGQTAVAAEMNRVIAEMEQDGTTDALRLKWNI